MTISMAGGIEAQFAWSQRQKPWETDGLTPLTANWLQLQSS